MIEIVFNNGDMMTYQHNEYTDYRYDGKYFIVLQGKKWIGFYNLRYIEYITIGRGNADKV